MVDTAPRRDQSVTLRGIAPAAGPGAEASSPSAGIFQFSVVVVALFCFITVK